VDIPDLEEAALSAFVAFRNSFPDHGDELDRETPGNLDDELYFWQLAWDEKKPVAEQSQGWGFYQAYGNYIHSNGYRQMMTSGTFSCSSCWGVLQQWLAVQQSGCHGIM
jgi:hypothetical protein